MIWNTGRRTFDLAHRGIIMGVINVTPDSFSDGGNFIAVDAAVEHGLRLAEEGADILDIGGESTRPGAAPVTAEEELHRVIPVIEGLAGKTSAAISIDTSKASVARAAVEAGAEIINESIIGSVMRGKAIAKARCGPHEGVIPEVSGTAHLAGLAHWIIDPDDPLRHGFLVR